MDHRQTAGWEPLDYVHLLHWLHISKDSAHFSVDNNYILKGNDLNEHVNEYKTVFVSKLNDLLCIIERMNVNSLKQRNFTNVKILKSECYLIVGKGRM